MKARRKCKVSITGDSHAGGCAPEVSRNFDENFEVTDFVMAGSGLKFVTNAAKKEIITLTKDDEIVMWGSTNDTSKNESFVGLSHISSFVKNRRHTNIVIMNAPHRHDLDTSGVNNEVKVFNRILRNKMKMYDYAKVMETNLNGERLTQHGLHMNRLRKELISKTIPENINSVITRHQPSFISLK
jgi:hypothetical protein